MKEDQNPRRLLQIFNRYLEYGGEEGSVYRIGDALQMIHEVEYFITSSKDLSGGIWKLAAAPIKVHYNHKVALRLRRFQAVGRFQAWLIHNVFPTISPAAYDIAFAEGIPVIQFLHNYRISCVNGFFLNHGEPCIRCIDGNFFPAFQTACWQDSHLKSGLMGSVLRDVRKRGVFEKVSHWVALSEAQKCLHVRMGVPAERITVIPHFYNFRDDVPTRREASGLMFIGRLSREKGVDVLLRAWKLVAHAGRTLSLVGDGPDRGRLESIVRDENITNVEFLGFLPRDKQDRVWQSAAAMVVPSVWEEPFGMVVLEAWERGCGVIVSNCGGLNEIVDHEVNGLKFPVGDYEALAAAIEGVWADPGSIEQYVNEGRKKLRSVYSQERWLGSINGVIQNAVSSVK